MMTTHRLPPRGFWWRGAALAVSLICLPHAHVAAQDYEALQRRLEEGVRAGELTAPQARFMLDALRLAEDLRRSDDRDGTMPRDARERGEDRIREQAFQGELPTEQGRAWLNEIRRRVGRGRRDRAPLAGTTAVDGEGRQRRLIGAIQDLEIDRDKLRQVAGLMERMIAEIQDEGDQFELDPQMARYLAEELGMSDDKIDRISELAQRLAGEDSSKPAASDDRFRRRLTGGLVEAGIRSEQLPAVLGALDRIAADILASGESFKLDPATRELLEGMNLTERQIETVVGLARRLAEQQGPRPLPHVDPDNGGP